MRSPRTGDDRKGSTMPSAMSPPPRIGRSKDSKLIRCGMTCRYLPVVGCSLRCLPLSPPSAVWVDCCLHEFKKHHPTWKSTDNRPTSALTILCGGSWCHRCDAEVPSTPSRSVQAPSRTGPKHTPPLRHGREFLVFVVGLPVQARRFAQRKFASEEAHSAVVFHDPPATSKRWTGPVKS